MNWVERKRHRELLLIARSADLWNQVRSAILDACESYNKTYGASEGKKVKCEPENGRRIRVEKQIRETYSTNAHRDERVSVLISFEIDPPIISIVGNGPITKWSMPISSDDEDVFIGPSREKHIDADSFSEKALSPLLFPSGNYSDPF